MTVDFKNPRIVEWLKGDEPGLSNAPMRRRRIDDPIFAGVPFAVKDAVTRVARNLGSILPVETDEADLAITGLVGVMNSQTGDIAKADPGDVERAARLAVLEDVSGVATNALRRRTSVRFWPSFDSMHNAMYQIPGALNRRHVIETITNFEKFSFFPLHADPPEEILLFTKFDQKHRMGHLVIAVPKIDHLIAYLAIKLRLDFCHGVATMPPIEVLRLFADRFGLLLAVEPSHEKRQFKFLEHEFFPSPSTIKVQGDPFVLSCIHRRTRLHLDEYALTSAINPKKYSSWIA